MAGPGSGDGTLVAVRGDITAQDVDVVVNAANAAMAPGGGVCGAIARAAGLGVFDEAAARARTRFGGRVPSGEAVRTSGGRLTARWVVHAVGPVFDPSHDRAAELRSAYRRSLDLAAEVGAGSIAFPAISAGIYGWPVPDAAEQAVGAVHEWLAGGWRSFTEIRFVLFSDDVLAAFDAALRADGRVI